MQLLTTFWSKEVHRFDELLFVQGVSTTYESTLTPIHGVKLQDLWATAMFFRQIANDVLSPTSRKDLRDDKRWYQFAVMREGSVTGLKWFDLVLAPDLTLSHDIAFDTTLISRNALPVPLGTFPHFNDRAPTIGKYRELKLKARAYRCLANQILAYRQDVLRSVAQGGRAKN